MSEDNIIARDSAPLSLAREASLDQGSGVDVVLINFSDDFSLGTRAISSYLRKHGYICELVFMKRHNADHYYLNERNYTDLIKLLCLLKPKLVGFSVSTKVLPFAEEATRHIRSAMPDSTLLWGGWHATMNPERVLRSVDIDGVGVGECENTMLEVLERIDSGRDLQEIPGLWTLEGDDVRPMPQRPLISDLDEIPYFRYDKWPSYLIDNQGAHKFSVLPMGYGHDRYGYAVMTSRGCPYSCSFCSVPYLKKIYGNTGDTKYRLRRRSVDAVIKELEYARDVLNANYIWFFDEEFLFNRKWIREFLPVYRDKIGLDFYCEFHPDGMSDREFIDLLADAGLKDLEIGLQSGSQKTLKVFNRPHRKQDLLVELSSHLATKDITVSYDIILDNPIETEEDVRITLDYLLRMARPFRVGMYPLAFRDNYPLTENALSQGWITEDDLETDVFEQRRTEDGAPTVEGGVGEFPFVTLNHLNCLIYLTQVDYFPKWLIRYWSHSSFMQRHESWLAWLVMFLHRSRLAHCRTVFRRIKRFTVGLILSPKDVLATLAHFSLRKRASSSGLHAVQLPD